MSTEVWSLQLEKRTKCYKEKEGNMYILNAFSLSSLCMCVLVQTLHDCWITEFYGRKPKGQAVYIIV